MAQPRSTGLADISCGSQLRKQGLIAGHALTLAGGSIARESKTQSAAASGSTEAGFVAAFPAAKAAWHPRLILQ